MQERLADRRAMNFELRMAVALVAFDHDEMDRSDFFDQRRKLSSASPRSSCTIAQRLYEPTTTSVAPAMRWECESLPG